MAGVAYRWSVLVFLIAGFGMSPSRASAQTLGTGAVAGIVRDSTGAAIADAAVTLVHSESGIGRTARATVNGRFDFSLVPPGEYSLLAEQLGFRPLRTVGIRVRPGDRVEITATLAAVEQTPLSVDTVSFGGAPLAGRAMNLGTHLDRSRIDALPFRTPDLLDIARLDSRSSPELEMQGLPAYLSDVRMDGVPIRPLPRQWSGSAAFRGIALPREIAGGITLVTTDPDVEWSSAGGSLNAILTRGDLDPGVHAFGSWDGSSLRSAPSGVVGSEGTGLLGALRVGTPLRSGRGGLAFGLEGWRVPAVSRLASEHAAARSEVFDLLRTVHDLEPLPEESTTDALSGFVRLDWKVSETSDLNSWWTLGTSRPGPALHDRALAILQPPFERSALHGATTLTTRFSEDLHQEFRLLLDTSSRTSRGAFAGDGAIATAGVLSSGVSLGPRGDLPGRAEDTTIGVSEVLYMGSGAHRVKLGLTASVSRAEVAMDPRIETIFRDPADIQSGTGYLVGSTPEIGSPSITLPRGALFAQDRWAASRDLDLLFGVRLDLERLPVGEVATHEEWLSLTGMDLRGVSATSLRVSPRFGFVYDPADGREWLVRGSAGLYAGVSDPVLLGGWVAGAAGIATRRGFGEHWPTQPGLIDLVGTEATALTLLDPGFGPPRTLRAELGVSHLVGGETAVGLTALARRTDFVPSFHDLNVVPAGDRTDQYGTPVHGMLRQEGSLLFSDARSHRRFDSFDRVVAIGTSGESTHLGLTATVEHGASGPLAFFASYTLSRTRDNLLPGAGIGAASAVSPRSALDADADRKERSAFDVPHRLVAATRLRSSALGGVEVGFLYRFASGYPFTPSFPAGVDANADGSYLGDRVFVDPEVAGMQPLIDDWECLGDQIGRLAERSSCRTPARQSLDARVTLPFLRLGRHMARLVVDGVNLFASGESIVDPALYQIDPEGTLQFDEATGRYTLPLRANPAFGEARLKVGAERIFRLGIQVAH